MKVQYLCTLVCGEVIHQYDLLSTDVDSTQHLTVEAIILGLGAYFSPVNLLLNKKRSVCRGMRNPHGLKVNSYTTHLIDLNKYLGLFLGGILLVKLV